MKSIAIVVASLFATVAFAQAPAAKKEEAKPAAPAAKPADKKVEPAKSAPAKAEDKKAEAPKK